MPEAQNNIDRDVLYRWSRILTGMREKRTVVARVPSGADPLATVTVTGVLLGVVEPHHDGFANRWTDESRLWVTATMELFIPLRDVLEVYDEG